MKFTQFKIQNFKGIEEITIDLDKSPEANIYTLVGLNESGKTTILEAINLFTPRTEGVNALELSGTDVKDYNLLIPISKRDNFNDTIYLEVTLKLDEDDLRQINDFVLKNTKFKKVKPTETIKYYSHYKFKDSKFQNLDSRWTGFYGQLKNKRKEEFIHIGGDKYQEDNINIATFCRTLIPNILYFPNFLFEFPSKIYLETLTEQTPKEKFYIELIQDILYSLENDSNTEIKKAGVLS